MDITRQLRRRFSGVGLSRSRERQYADATSFGRIGRRWICSENVVAAIDRLY
jgi:hypothetical protein